MFFVTGVLPDELSNDELRVPEDFHGTAGVVLPQVTEAVYESGPFRDVVRAFLHFKEIVFVQNRLPVLQNKSSVSFGPRWKTRTVEVERQAHDVLTSK